MAHETPKPEEWEELAALGELEVPSREELAEARLLVVAAQGKQQVGLSEEAEVGLALVRMATSGQLSQDAKDRIWQDLPLPESSSVEAPRGFSVFDRKWLSWALLLPMAAAGVVFWHVSSGDPDVKLQVGASSVPQPNAALLSAQAKWAASSEEREPFERGMSSYRLAVLEGLE